MGPLETGVSGRKHALLVRPKPTSSRDSVRMADEDVPNF